MRLKAIFDRIRLLPVLIGFCGILLPLKIVGVAAFAQSSAPASSSQAAAAPEKASAPAPKSGPQPAPDDADETSSARVDVLNSLSKRRSELDRRAGELNMRENLITAAEKRVDEKIAALKDLQQSIQKLLAARDAAEQKQVDALVKTYSAMKPRDAARIFDGLDDDVLIPVASAMKPDALAPILAKMQPDAARKVTLQLAGRLNLPDTPQAGAATQQTAQASAAQPAAPPAQAATPGG